ncbi:hypothetical protein AMR42_06475 [Limnothrix sp. PR1529]|nr:hypothetical protein BCR12_04765 [Limnothrix sp. P13C2]PIB14331.1 hypothetical protein AMR42_06475 [Limnothrix sp. PR1529]
MQIILQRENSYLGGKFSTGFPQKTPKFSTEMTEFSTGYVTNDTVCRSVGDCFGRSPGFS